MIAMTDGRELVELAWCENVWCGEVYNLVEGWAGRCPSCLALADEHLVGTHTSVTGLVEVCSGCRRDVPDQRGLGELGQARFGGRGRK